MTSKGHPGAPVTGTRWALPAPIGALSRGLGLGGPTVRHVSGGIVGGIGGVMALWHASVLHASLGAPAIALLGTTVLLVLSILLVGLAGWMVREGVDPVISTRIADWLILTGSAFATVGLLVALHLEFMLQGFDGVPLVADLVTVGAGMGVLIGQYDGRSQQYHSRMRTERDRFVSLFDNLPNPGVHYVWRGDEPVVHDANDAFGEVFGFDLEEIRGTPVDDLVVPAGREGDAAAFTRRLETGEVVGTEVRLLTASGLRDFQLYVVPYREDEGFWIAVDVTERKQHIRRLEVLNRVLRHDLRTDTNIIAGTAEMLPASPEAETIRDRAMAMARRGERARRVERVLDSTTDRQTLDLTPLLRDRVASFEDATVHTDIEPATVFGSDGLGEAIDELLANAVEHAAPRGAADTSGSGDRGGAADTSGSGDRGGAADQGRPTVWVRTSVGETFATVEIADDGPGLPEMERAVLDAGRETPLQHSSGLGLWLVRWIVEDLGGEVHASTRNGGGTSITLDLPRANAGADQ